MESMDPLSANPSTKENIKKRSANISAIQKETLIEYMHNHEELRKGAFSKTFSHKDLQNQWKEITNILNAIPGSTKTWTQWRKAWQDSRTSAKKKSSENKKEKRVTGGGKPKNILITPMDEKILDMIGLTTVSGHAKTDESYAEMIRSENDNKVDVIDDTPDRMVENEVVLDNERIDITEEGYEKITDENEVNDVIRVDDSKLQQSLSVRSQLAQSHERPASLVSPQVCQSKIRPTPSVSPQVRPTPSVSPQVRPTPSVSPQVRPSPILRPQVNQPQVTPSQVSQVSEKEGSKSTSKKNSRNSSVKRLNHTIAATEDLAKQTKEKIRIKKEYYEKKLEIQQQQVAAIRYLADVIKDVKFCSTNVE